MSSMDEVKAAILAAAANLDNAVAGLQAALDAVGASRDQLIGAVEGSVMSEAMYTLGAIDRVAIDVLPSTQVDVLRIQQDMQDLAARL